MEYIRLIDKIKNAGIENCLFIVPMKPVRTFVFIAYTSSSDPDFLIPCVISEDRYKVDKGYKITLKSTYDGFGEQHFYLSDLESLIDNGSVKFYVKG